MADQSSSRAEPTGSATFDPVKQLQEAGLGNMVGASTAWMEALSDMSAEILGFVAERIKEYVHTQHEILHCKDIGQLQHIQAQFIQKAVDQYHAETGKLVEMSTKAFKAPIKNGED